MSNYIKKIHPIKGNKEGIVFAANDKFIPYFNVALQSLIDSGNVNKIYDVVVLHKDISEESQNKTKKQFEKYKNLFIRFYDMSSVVKDTFYTENVQRLSQEAYFRIYIPGIFDDDYKKILYLDADMVFKRDIFELFDTDLEGKTLGAVRDYSGTAKAYAKTGRSLRRHREKVVKVKLDDYFISGLLLIDLGKMKEKYTSDMLVNISLKRKWLQHDQDVLNNALSGDVKILSGRWNVLRDYRLINQMPKQLIEEYKDSVYNPYIVHYGGNIKPWKESRKWQEEFWMTAVKTNMFDKIICNLYSEKLDISGKERRIVEISEKIRQDILNNKCYPAFANIFGALQGYLNNIEVNKETLISVIVPVFNAEKTIERSINSLLNQTYKNLQIIVVNDGSTDKTLDIVNNFAKKDKRIEVVTQENRGVGAARNAGLKKVKGEYITWLDADDYIMPDTYECLVNGINKYHAPITSIKAIFENGEKKELINNWVDDKILSSFEASKELLKYKIRAYLWDKIFQKELFDGFSFDEVKSFEDTRVMHLLFEKAQFIACIKNAKHYHVIYQDSLSHNRKISYKLSRLDAICSRAKDLMGKGPDLDKLIAKDLLNSLYDVGKSVLRAGKGEFKKNKQEILKGIKKVSVFKDLVNKNLTKRERREFRQLCLAKRCIYRYVYIKRKISLKKAVKETLKKTLKGIKSVLGKIRRLIPRPIKFIKLKVKGKIYGIINGYKASIDQKMKENDEKVLFLLSSAFSQNGENYEEARKKLFLAMPKWGGEVGNIQQGSLTLLKKLKEICEKHKLTYWILGGTLLGAVRHKGFIPWDDDIDVGMLRIDLEKLFDIINSYPELRLKKYYKCSPNGGWSVTKLTYADEKKPYWVDIMCHDWAGNANFSEDELWEKISFIREKNKKELMGIQRQMIGCYEDEEIMFDFDDESVRMAYEKHIAMLPGIENKTYIYRSIDCYCSDFEKLYPVDKMMPFVNLEFEGDVYPAPKEYDWWLKSRYTGDYWSLPNDIGKGHVRFLESKKKRIK